MHRRGMTWLGSGAALLLAACAHRHAPEQVVRVPVWFLPSQPCSVPSGTALPPVRATDTLSVTYATRYFNVAQAYAARHVPAGYLSGPTRYGPNGRAELWLRDTTARQAVLQALRPMPGFQLLSGIPAASIDARHADWDSAALYDWLHYIMDRPGVPGVNGWGIEQGHLRLDLMDAESVPALVAFLEQLRVPCGLVKFGVYGPIHVT